MAFRVVEDFELVLFKFGLKNPVVLNLRALPCLLL
jgi:hypothetical protein